MISGSSAPSASRAFFLDLASLGDSVALVDSDGAAISYRDLETRVDGLAAQIGTPRRLVFLEAANSVEAVAAYLACLKGGHAVYLYSPADRAAVVRLGDAYRPNLVVSIEESEIHFGWRHRDDLALHPELAVLLSTSGSTGSPKLVKLSRANLDANACAIASSLSLGPDARAITSLAFNYSYGLSVVNSHLAAGGSLVLTDESVTEPAFWERFVRHSATSFAGVPYTFESLHESRFAFDRLPTLRHVTQAGGRLSPAVVRHFATMADAQGWRLYVMYGQTEAAPRIACLPAELALTYPECIGLPIPGGRIELLDQDNQPITTPDTPGELAYSGPNVMMGYADRLEDLATDCTPPRLLTGDIACRNTRGLFYVVGRTARFVKPFGLRINLDDLEVVWRSVAPAARCAGNDNAIVVAVPVDQYDAAVVARPQMASAVRLPEFIFRVVPMPAMPQLANGKVDYAAIAAHAAETPAPASSPARRSGPAAIFTSEFVRAYVDALAELLGLRSGDWQSVDHIFRTILARPSVAPTDSFKSLAGDSLSYVQMMTALRQYLGRLPGNWADLSVRQLEHEQVTNRGAI